jgi:hypothetical protein
VQPAFDGAFGTMNWKDEDKPKLYPAPGYDPAALDVMLQKPAPVDTPTTGGPEADAQESATTARPLAKDPHWWPKMRKLLRSRLAWSAIGATVLVATLALWRLDGGGQGEHGTAVPPNPAQTQPAAVPPQPAQTQPAAWTAADLKIHKADFADSYFRTHENHVLSELANRMEKEGVAEKTEKTDSIVLVVECIPLEAERRAGKLKIAARHGEKCLVSGFAVVRDSDGTVASPISVTSGKDAGTVQMPKCDPKAAAVFLLRIAAPEEWFRPLMKRMTPSEAQKAIERELEFSIPDS